MLLRMLKSFSGRRSVPVERDRDESPLEILEQLARAHRSAPVEAHMKIAYRGMQIGPHDLVELVQRSLGESRVVQPKRKQLHRLLSSFFLAQYYLYSLDIEGARAECGVFMGTSALLACRAAQTRIPSYSGSDLHLIDSFEGLGDPSEEDRFQGRDEADPSAFVKGAYAAPIERARATLAPFPGVSFHRGWIPDVFAELPEGAWSFVHLDVDHHAPTYEALRYFYPRLTEGGVIICDDYGSPTFPGARRAWHRYSDENSVPFVVLDTGQSVILKTPAI